MSRVVWLSTMAIITTFSWGSAANGGTIGIGVLGDSYSDEYRFYPPDRSTTRNWVELLAETRGLNFGEYSTVDRGEPRNQGYAHNWARSDAETKDLIAAGQHRGVAEQVRRGEVGVVVIFIGGNDFIHALRAGDPLNDLSNVGARAIENHRLAVETILAASPSARVMLVTLPDLFDLPEFALPLREGRLSLQVATAYRNEVRRFNDHVRSMVQSPGRVGILDMERLAILAIKTDADHVFLAGRVVNRARPANQPDALFLADQRHLGTVGQAAFAKLMVDALNSQFGLRIRPLGFREMLAGTERRPTMGLKPSLAARATGGARASGAVGR